jgi:hypothetical protein
MRCAIIPTYYVNKIRVNQTKKITDLGQCYCGPPRNHAASAKSQMKLSASAQAAAPYASSPPWQILCAASSPRNAQPKIETKRVRSLLLYEIT